MASNDRARVWQEKQRKEAVKAKLAGMTVPELSATFKKATRPPKPVTSPPQYVNFPYLGTATISVNGTTTTGTWPVVSTGSGSFTYMMKEEGPALPPQHPSDDVTRQMVERAVLAAIDRCLAADHYPKGIALTQTAFDALKGSPLVRSGYWSEADKKFLDLPLHIVEMIDPLDVEVGW